MISLPRYDELTLSERYLAQLCRHTFLRLWAWPRIYRDQIGPNSEGKEVCDFLVVFDNIVIIFSDKYCSFTSTGDLRIDWARWYKRAIDKSVLQLLGAERWIRNYPDRLYIDKNCKEKFPISIGQTGSLEFHRIAVAHGAGERCRAELGGRGSLLICPEIAGPMHYDSSNHQVLPFHVGKPSEKSFVHVMDDATLDVILKNVDTIVDFANYLRKKEQFIESGLLGVAAGEEELLAYYLAHMNDSDEHDFVFKEKASKIYLDEGLWDEYETSSERKAKINEDTISYAWDELINTFAHHILKGNLYFKSHEAISEQETGLKLMAKEPRVMRRFLAKSFLEVVRRASSEKRSARLAISTLRNKPNYVFLALLKDPAHGIDQYRNIRRELLIAYCKAAKVVRPEAIHIVGIATEPLEDRGSLRSEDLVYMNCEKWTPELQNEAVHLQKSLNLFSHVREQKFTEHEYPSDNILSYRKGRNRNKPCYCGSGKKYKNCCGKK